MNRMLFKQLSSLLAFSLLLIACSGTTKQYISPEYENQQSDEPVSLLVIEKDDFANHIGNHNFGELRINEQPLFRERLFSIFTEATGANANREMKAIDIDQSSFEVREFTEGGTNLQILAPARGTELRTDSEVPRFVVLLDGFRFDSYEELVGGDSYAGHEPEVVPRLTFQTNYLVWDNQSGEAIAWGTIGSDKVIDLSRIEEIYDSLIRDSMLDMAPKTPFARQRG